MDLSNPLDNLDHLKTFDLVDPMDTIGPIAHMLGVNHRPCEPPESPGLNGPFGLHGPLGLHGLNGLLGQEKTGAAQWRIYYTQQNGLLGIVISGFRPVRDRIHTLIDRAIINALNCNS